MNTTEKPEKPEKAEKTENEISRNVTNLNQNNEKESNEKSCLIKTNATQRTATNHLIKKKGMKGCGWWCDE